MIRHCFTMSAAFMAKPCIRSWNRLKRAACFLKSHLRGASEFIEQEKCTTLKMSVDSDWAKGLSTHQSISCCHAELNKRLIKSYVGTRVAFAVGVP